MPTAQMQVMVKNLRAEAGHALSVSQGVNQVDTLKYLLARTQEELWVAFTWPELTLRVETPLMAGQYLYPFSVQMDFDQIRETWGLDTGGSDWHPVDYGIPESHIHAGGTNSDRSDPVRLWAVESPTQFRVWPTPDTNGGYIRQKGNRKLAAFSADTDVSTLDATVIVLFAAAEVLARAKAEDAAGKMQKAQRHLQKLLGNKISAKTKVVAMGSGSPGRGAYDNVIRINSGS